MEVPGPQFTADEKEELIRSDTLTRQQMIEKLVDREKQHLRLALHQVERTEPGGTAFAQSTGRLDLFLRYQTTARRDFYRALREYQEIKRLKNSSHT